MRLGCRFPCRACRSPPGRCGSPETRCLVPRGKGIIQFMENRALLSIAVSIPLNLREIHRREIPFTCLHFAEFLALSCLSSPRWRPIGPRG